MEKLKSCPFCGSKIVEVVYGDRRTYVICRNCNAQGPESSDADYISHRLAIEYWNKACHFNDE